MKISNNFDGGKLVPYQIDGDAVTFDFREDNILNVIVDDVPENLKIICLFNDITKAKRHLLGQGLIVSTDGSNYSSYPFGHVDDE